MITFHDKSLNNRYHYCIGSVNEFLNLAYSFDKDIFFLHLSRSEPPKSLRKNVKVIRSYDTASRIFSSRVNDNNSYVVFVNSFEGTLNIRVANTNSVYVRFDSDPLLFPKIVIKNKDWIDFKSKKLSIVGFA